jgi:hypothetical protein
MTIQSNSPPNWIQPFGHPDLTHSAEPISRNSLFVPIVSDFT